MNHSLETCWRDCAETHDTTVESLEELKLFFLRTLHVHNADRVVVWFQMLASFESCVKIRIRKINEGELDSMSSFLVVRPPFFDIVLKFCLPDVVELLCTIVRKCFLREKVRLCRTSRMSLYRPSVQKFRFDSVLPRMVNHSEVFAE